MGNDLSHNTYLRTDACSARNITWQYIHTFGQVPKSYTSCSSYGAILAAHCCSDGICTPNPESDREFRRYEWAKENNGTTGKPWDGLGNPYEGRVWPTDIPEQLNGVWRAKMRRKDREHNATQYTWWCPPFFHGGWSEEGDFPVDIKDHKRSEKDQWEVCDEGGCVTYSFWDHSANYTKGTPLPIMEKPATNPRWVDVEVQHSTAESVEMERALEGLRVGVIAGVEFTG